VLFRLLELLLELEEVDLLVLGSIWRVEVIEAVKEIVFVVVGKDFLSYTEEIGLFERFFLFWVEFFVYAFCITCV